MPEVGEILRVNRKTYRWCGACNKWIRHNGLTGTVHVCRRW